MSPSLFHYQNSGMRAWLGSLLRVFSAAMVLFPPASAQELKKALREALPINRSIADAAACVTEEAKEGNRNLSVLTVRLKVVNGKLAVDQDASRGLFKPSPLFLCRAGITGAGAVQMTLALEKELLLELNALMQKHLEPFFKLALPLSNAANPPTDVSPPAALQASHDWKTYRQLYVEWNDSRPPNFRAQFHPRLVLFDKVINANANLMKRLADTPLRAFFRDEVEDDSPLNDKLDDVNGQVTFHINDPIGDLLQTQDYNLVMPAPVTKVAGAAFIAPDQKQIAAALAPLKGKFWREPLVHSYINDFFLASRSGYQRIVSDIAVSQALALPKQINIPPVPQIVRIVFYGIKDDSEIKRGLRQILTDREFAVYLGKKSQANFQIIKECPDKIDAPNPDDPSAAAGEQEIKISCRYVTYDDLGAKDHPPYLNATNLAQQQIALAALDLAMGPGRFIPENEYEANEEGEDANVVRFVELQINKREAEKKDNAGAPLPDSSPAPVTSPAGASADVTAPMLANTTASAAANIDDLKRQRERCVTKPCLNFLGGEVVYRPGQGIRFYGLYERMRVLRGNFAIRVGNFGGYTITGDGAWDYLFFDKLNRRLAFQIHGATDSTANRLFNQVKTDQRRTGGMLHAEYELLTNPRVLTLSFGGKHETVELTQADKTVAKQNVTSFQTGAVFLTASRDVLWRRTLQLEPILRFAPGLGAQQKSFGIFSLTGIVHQYLPNRQDFIVRGRVDAASKNTPLFEQPFLGGEDSVRGFRVDDAIGRRHWVLQHEYQFPVPGVKPESTGLLAVLRSQVQLAVFFDVGGMYQTTSSTAGARFGSGFGIRFNYGPQVLKFDWAYGIGDGAQGRGHGRLYFTVSREIPRLIRR